ncbi:hypothetical protein L6452_15723 [Arctium lappa]|uniref:Uncharacterized protein n=1 Tax=Arctium lappa TaxID=4217 RepID=A0ACB9CPI0_ARCLA|nr:hypothetical protein L6452_15723 [Arctium lappa]
MERRRGQQGKDTVVQSSGRWMANEAKMVVVGGMEIHDHDFYHDHVLDSDQNARVHDHDNWVVVFERKGKTDRVVKKRVVQQNLGRFREDEDNEGKRAL